MRSDNSLIDRWKSGVWESTFVLEFLNRILSNSQSVMQWSKYAFFSVFLNIPQTSSLPIQTKRHEDLLSKSYNRTVIWPTATHKTLNRSSPKCAQGRYCPHGIWVSNTYYFIKFYPDRIRGFFAARAWFCAPSGPKFTRPFVWVLKTTHSQDARTDFDAKFTYIFHRKLQLYVPISTGQIVCWFLVKYSVDFILAIETDIHEVVLSNMTV